MKNFTYLLCGNAAKRTDAKSCVSPPRVGAWLRAFIVTLALAMTASTGVWAQISDTIELGNGDYFTENGTLTGHTTFKVDEGNTAYISGQLSGNYILTKTGAGTLVILSENPDFTGETRIQEGVLTLYSLIMLQPIRITKGDIPNTSAITISAGATLRFDDMAPREVRRPIMGAGNLEVIRTGAGLILNNFLSYTGSTTVRSGTLTVSGSTSTNTSASGISLTSTSSRINFSVPDMGTMYFTSEISGVGNVEKSGEGTLNLGGNHTYEGRTVVSDGTLEIRGGTNGTSNINSTSGILLSSATSLLRINAGSQSILSFSKEISGVGSVEKTGGGELILSGNHTATGTFSQRFGKVDLSGLWAGDFRAGADLTITGNASIGGSFSMSDGKINMNLSEPTPSKLSIAGEFKALRYQMVINVTGIGTANSYPLITANSGITDVFFRKEGVTEASEYGFTDDTYTKAVTLEKSPSFLIEETGIKYASLREAVALVENGQTIQLLNDHTHHDWFKISTDKNFNIRLNGNKLNIENGSWYTPPVMGLEIFGNEITLLDAGNGELNVRSAHGGLTSSGIITINNARANLTYLQESSGSRYARALDVSGGKVTVLGNITSADVGVYVSYGEVTVWGAIDAERKAIEFPYGSGKVIVEGNISNGTINDKQLNEYAWISSTTMTPNYIEYKSPIGWEIYIKHHGVENLIVPTTAIAGIPLSLNYTTVPANATFQSVLWEIDQDGGTGSNIEYERYLKATATGIVKLKATIKDGRGLGIDYVGTFDITVSDESSFVPVNGITLLKSTTTAGEDLILEGKVSPDNASDQNIDWQVISTGTTSSGATINGNKLIATGTGNVRVLATIANGYDIDVPFTKPFDVNVTEDVISSEPVCFNSYTKVEYSDVQLAVNQATIGDTIRLLKDINYNRLLGIPGGKSIVIDLKGFDLKVNAGWEEGNDLGIGVVVGSEGASSKLYIEGTGEFNCTGPVYGLAVMGGSRAEVTNATATGVGANADHWVTGVYATDGSLVFVKGNVETQGNVGTRIGVHARVNSNVHVDGVINVTNGVYVLLADKENTFILKMKADIEPSTTRLGYETYTHPFSEGASSVWVKTSATVPDAPGDFRVDAGSRAKISLGWTTPNDNGSPLTKYQISWGHSSTYTEDWEDYMDVSGTSHIIVVTSDIEYTFEIRAVNSQGAGPSSRQTVTSPSPELPTITGPSGMTLQEGYTATSSEEFYMEAQSPASFHFESDFDEITFDDMRVHVAPGLTAGEYTVLLSISNDVGRTDHNFTLTVIPAEPPTIDGPDEITMEEGYTDTFIDLFSISGAEPVEVSSNNANVKWDTNAEKILIEAGLTEGTYVVVLTATNNAGSATHTFTLKIVKTYKVTIISDGEDHTEDGYYTAGTAVEIFAGKAPADQEFINWTSDDVVIPNAASERTTFIMPARDVTVTANFELKNMIISVTVKPDLDVTATKNGTKDFTATVEFKGDIATTVVWSVEGSKTGTSTIAPISTGARLTVGQLEPTGTILTVRATSTANDTKWDEVEVTVLPFELEGTGEISGFTLANALAQLWEKTGTQGSSLKSGVPAGYELVAITRADAIGYYSFKNLPKGTYMVIILIPGYDSTPSTPIELEEGETIDDVNFTVKGTEIIPYDGITGIGELPNVNPLNAWVRDGLLHITGLIPGELLSIYSATGSLMYQNIATSGEADVKLSVQGVYIVRQGVNTLKVSFYH